MKDIDYLTSLSVELRSAIQANYMPEVDRVAKEMADQIDAMKDGKSLAPKDGDDETPKTAAKSKRDAA